MVWYLYKSKYIIQNWNSNLTFSELHLYIYIYIYYRHRKIGKCCTHFQNMYNIYHIFTYVYNICYFLCIYNVSLLCKYNINIQRSFKKKKKRQLTKLTKPKTLFMSLLALFINFIEIEI